jgi:hypothetical protein
LWRLLFETDKASFPPWGIFWTLTATHYALCSLTKARAAHAVSSGG